MKLRYTSPALTDLESILDDIAAASPSGADRVQGRLRKLVELLPLYPNIGARTDDPTIRRLAIAPYPYLVFYEPTETEIVIHAIRHGARDPSGMPGSDV